MIILNKILKRIYANLSKTKQWEQLKVEYSQVIKQIQASIMQINKLIENKANPYKINRSINDTIDKINILKNSFYKYQKILL